MENRQNSYIVYKHTTPSGKVYIGITKNKPNYRWRSGKGYINNTYFYKAIQKYGWENIKHEILFSNLCGQDASDKERELIAFYNSTDPTKGYNLTTGGTDKFFFSKEERERRSKRMLGHPVSESAREAMRKNHYDCRGSNNSNYGKRWTDEQIAIRQSHRKYARGAECVNARPILQKNLDGTLVKRWGCINDAAKEYARTSIKDCLRGKYKQHRGYIWEYEVKNE